MKGSDVFDSPRRNGVGRGFERRRKEGKRDGCGDWGWGRGGFVEVYGEGEGRGSLGNVEGGRLRGSHLTEDQGPAVGHDQKIRLARWLNTMDRYCSPGCLNGRGMSWNRSDRDHEQVERCYSTMKTMPLRCMNRAVDSKIDRLIDRHHVELEAEADQL